jgi:DNA-binding transcriptional LysR family regulator
VINVKHLAVFRAVVKTGSVSGAARVLHISQPAVTKTLHMLEESIGLRLFERIKGRLLITPEAQALMPQVERLFGNVDAVQKLTEEIRQGFAGSLTIATVATLASSIVSAGISRFHREFPKVQFDLKALSTRQVLDAVTNNQADIGIIDVSEGGPDMDVFELCRADITCVMRSDHPLAGASSITPRDIAGETLITFAEDTTSGWAIREALRKQKLPVHVAFTVNHTLSAFSLVQEGSGIAVVDPFPMLLGSFPKLVIRPFRPAIESRPRVLIANTRPSSVISGAFVKMLKLAADEMVSESKLLLKQPYSRPNSGAAMRSDRGVVRKTRSSRR